MRAQIVAFKHTQRYTCAIRQQQLAWCVLISLCLILHHQAVVRGQADDLIDGIGVDGENKAYEDYTNFSSGDAERKRHSWFDRCQNPFRLAVAVIMSHFQSDLFLSFTVHTSFLVFKTFLSVVLSHLDSLGTSATERKEGFDIALLRIRALDQPCLYKADQIQKGSKSLRPNWKSGVQNLI